MTNTVFLQGYGHQGIIKELQRLSDARSTCRRLALDIIASTYISNFATLEHIADDNDKTTAIQAIGQVHSFKFFATLIIFWVCDYVLSDQLLSKTVDLFYAAGLVLLTCTCTTATLKDFGHN